MATVSDALLRAGTAGDAWSGCDTDVRCCGYIDWTSRARHTAAAWRQRARERRWRPTRSRPPVVCARALTLLQPPCAWHCSIILSALLMCGAPHIGACYIVLCVFAVYTLHSQTPVLLSSLSHTLKPLTLHCCSRFGAS